MALRQFRLRTLFVLVALCACFFVSVLTIIDRVGWNDVTTAELALVEVGMTPSQVLRILGRPDLVTGENGDETWCYGFILGTFIVFEDGKCIQAFRD